MIICRGVRVGRPCNGVSGGKGNSSLGHGHMEEIYAKISLPVKLQVSWTWIVRDTGILPDFQPPCWLSFMSETCRIDSTGPRPAGVSLW